MFKLFICLILYFYFKLTICKDEICEVKLGNNMTLPLLNKYFKSNTSNGITYIVYFKLKYFKNNREYLFDIKGKDTFSPELWVWAAGKGKNLLRLPLDNKILSLGLLTIQTSTIDILIDYSTYKCFLNSSFEKTIHTLGKYISENVTSNGSSVNQDTQGPIVCRSVYAFYQGLIGSNPKGLGFDCCSPGEVYTCDMAYSDGFEVVWYGPLVFIVLVYLIGSIHLYRIYNKLFLQIKIMELTGFQKTVDEIKLDLVNRIVHNTEKIIRIKDPDELISVRERSGFLDVLGVGKANHKKIIFILRLMVGFLILICFYSFWGILIYVYGKTLKYELSLIQDSQTAYLNVIGHIGWLHLDKKLGIFRYAVFEAFYTAIVPFLGIYLYFSFKYRNYKPNSQNENQSSIAEHINKLNVHWNSKKGKVLQSICIILLLIHFIFLTGVFLAYMVYLIGLGIFANIDVVSPWIIPITVSLHLFSTSFNRAYNHYNHIKEQMFNVCFEDYRSLVFKQNREYFLPRDLVETYYIPLSKNIIYACFMKIFFILTLMLLLILVVLTLQYPYNTKLTSLVPFIGVQIVFILPYLSKIANGDVKDSLSNLDETIMRRDLNNFIDEYIKKNPDLTTLILRTRSNSVNETMNPLGEAYELERLSDEDMLKSDDSLDQDKLKVIVKRKREKKNIKKI